MLLSRKWIICSFVIVMLSGCTGTSQYLKDQLSGKGPTLVTPRRIPSQLPGHAERALAGLIQKMRHQEAPGIRFDPQGRHEILEAFDYSGFRVRNIDIAKAAVLEEDGKEAVFDLGGFLHFSDGYARATTVAFELIYRYVKTPNQPPLILQSATSSTLPAYPKVITFLIPAKAFTRAGNKRPVTFGEYLRFAERHGIDTRATETDIAQRKELESLSTLQRLRQSMKTPKGEERDLVVMTFCFDRLPPESLLSLEVNTKTAEPVVMDFFGWKVLALGGKGRLFDPSAPITVDVYYQQDAKAFRARQRIGRFSSLKYFPEDHPEVETARLSRDRKPVAVPREEIASEKPVGGPIERGLHRLDVRKYADAVTVQSRLQELGYYTMKVDGDFGRGSRSALKAWSRDTLGQETGVLTPALQKALFKGTGL